jgi:hypothetical protein
MKQTVAVGVIKGTNKKAATDKKWAVMLHRFIKTILLSLSVIIIWLLINKY